MYVCVGGGIVWLLPPPPPHSDELLPDCRVCVCVCVCGGGKGDGDEEVVESNVLSFAGARVPGDWSGWERLQVRHRGA